jgi:hypothetical protein
MEREVNHLGRASVQYVIEAKMSRFRLCVCANVYKEIFIHCTCTRFCDVSSDKSRTPQNCVEQLWSAKEAAPRCE